MIKYIFKRLLQLIPILIGITFLSFAMMRLAGGDAVTYMYKMQVPQFRRRLSTRQERNMVWISRFLSSMQSGLREWQRAIWEPAMYQSGMFMTLL